MSEAPLPISSCRSVGDKPTREAATASKQSSRRIVYKCKTIEAYDGSQGWCMVCLVFLTNFLVLGFFKSLGMLTKILNKEFDVTMHVYILMCITYSLNCAAGPLACYLTRRFSARSIALVGTSMVSFGLILSWFAESLTFLYFSVGVLTGVGSGLTYPSGVILVGNYFVGTKRAGLANALIVSGSPVGGMIMPGVISALSQIYSSRGAFIIVGGLMLHSIICVRAYTPPPKGIPRDNMDSQDDETLDNADKPEECVKEVSDGSLPLIEEIKLEETSLDKGKRDDGPNSELPEISHSTGILKIYERDNDDVECNKPLSGLSIDVRYRPNASHGASPLLPDLVGSGTKSVFLCGTGQKINAQGSPIVPSELKAKESNVSLRPFGNICNKCRDKSRLVASDGGLECYRKGEGESTPYNMLQSAFQGKEVVARMLEIDRNLNVRRFPVPACTASAGSRPYILSLDHSCIILCSETDLLKKGDHKMEDSFNNNRRTVSHFRIGSGDDASASNIPETSENGSCIQRIKRWILKSPLRNSTYVFLLLSNNATAISTNNIHLMVSQLVEETDDSYTKSSLLYLLISVADLTGRLLGAFLADRNVISPSIIYAIGLIFAGISSSFLAALSTYNQLCGVALAFGLFSGCHIGIYGFLLTDIVGLENIHLGYGISMFLNGTLQCIAILVSGRAVSLNKGGFTWLAPLLGAILTCGGLIWTCSLLICQRKDAPTRRRKDSEYCMNTNNAKEIPPKNEDYRVSLIKNSSASKFNAISLEELAKHNDVPNKNAWICIKGIVYDVSAYASKHPGGIDKIIKYAGKDATDVFNMVHAYVNADAILKSAQVGILKGHHHEAQKKPLNTKLKEKEWCCFGGSYKKPTTNFKQDSIVGTYTVEFLHSSHENDWTVGVKDQRFLQVFKKIDISQAWYSSYELPEPLCNDHVSVQFKNNYEHVEITIRKPVPTTMWARQSHGLKDCGTFVPMDRSQAQYPGFILSKRCLTHNIILFAIQICPSARIGVPIGHHVSLHIGGTSRPFTPVLPTIVDITSEERPKIDPHVLYFIIKIYPNGACSKVLDQVEIDDGREIPSLQIGTPQGSFDAEFLNDFNLLLLIAGGTGITPMIKIICHFWNMSERMTGRQVVFMYFCETEHDLIWKSQFYDMHEAAPWFHYFPVLTKPAPGWEGLKGRINDELVKNCIAELRSESKSLKKACVCGPPGFNSNTTDRLTSHNSI
ncbi:Cytochrome b5 reductase 4, partial [Orchesella cincta]